MKSVLSVPEEKDGRGGGEGCQSWAGMGVAGVKCEMGGDDIQNK